MLFLECSTTLKKLTSEMTNFMSNPPSNILVIWLATAVVVLVQSRHVLFHCGKHSENCYLSLPTVQSEQNFYGNVFNMCVRKMFLYGSETWPVVTEGVQELVAPDSGVIRWIYGVSLKDHTPTADAALELTESPWTLVTYGL